MENNDKKVVVVSLAKFEQVMSSHPRPELRPAVKPVAQPLAVSKKAFQIDYDGGGGRISRPRVPFNPVVHKKFKPAEMFHTIWETSNFYDLFLPEGSKYIEMSFFGQDNALADAVGMYERVGKRGFAAKYLPEPHRVLFGDYDDNGQSDTHGTALLIPVSSPIKNLKELGLTITIRNKPDKPKVRKYMRRVHAHHMWAVPGTVVGNRAVPTGDVVTAECGGITFDILHVDVDAMDPMNKALADGIHLIDVELLRNIGNAFDIPELQAAEVGDSFKGTELDPIGLGKGFYHVVNMGTFGIIVYGPKTQVKFDKFFLGSLGDVKGGPARTCLQSIGCFITEESKDLWINQMTLFTVQLTEALHDEKKLKHMFLTTVGSVMDLLEGREREPWVLVEAIRHGLPILHNPGLFRRVVRYLIDRVMDCERGRIPYGDAAHRYNLMPDLTCFDYETGLVDHTKSVIPEHSVVCMDADQGPFAMYRQPLGNAREAVIASNIHNRRFRRFLGRERVILGPSALAHLAQMGGGDMDDAVIGTDDLTWIEVIGKAEYPVTELPEFEAQALDVDLDKDNIYRTGGVVKIGNQTVIVKPTIGRTYPTTWSMEDYFEAGTEAFNPQLSIGPVDNAVRLDLMLSGVHKAHMLRALAEKVEAETDKGQRDKLIAGYHWLEDREDFQLREVGSNLESFIDFVKMRKGDENVINKLTQQINDLSSQTVVFPECWTYLGRKVVGRIRGRIPMNRRMAQDYILAPSLVCETLNTIKMKHAQLKNTLREEEWSQVQRPPESIRNMFPVDQQAIVEAREIRTLWREWWNPFIMEKNVTPSDEAYKIITEGGVITLTDKDEHGKNIVMDVQGIYPKFNYWKNEPGGDPTQDRRLSIAVEIAFQTYRSRHSEAAMSETGLWRGFPDGVLWSSTIGMWYIQALKLAGLTGLYLPVRFDRYSSNLRKGQVEVKITGGVVTRKSDAFPIGYVIYDQPVDDGEYVMEDGIVTITPAAAELTESVTEVDTTYTNPVTSDLEPEA